jgi:biopolymer transport protein ExbD
VRIRTRLEARASLESVAITDIILNMFIFFFTSFSLLYTFNPAREARVTVTLPQGSSRQIERRRDPLVVTVDAAEKLSFGGRALTRQELAAALAATLAREPGRPVIVRADRIVALETVVGLLELARDAGAAEAGIAIREKPAGAQPPR